MSRKDENLKQKADPSQHSWFQRINGRSHHFMLKKIQEHCEFRLKASSLLLVMELKGTVLSCTWNGLVEMKNSRPESIVLCTSLANVIWSHDISLSTLFAKIFSFSTWVRLFHMFCEANWKCCDVFLLTLFCLQDWQSIFTTNESKDRAFAVLKANNFLLLG